MAIFINIENMIIKNKTNEKPHLGELNEAVRIDYKCLLHTWNGIFHDE